MTMKKMLMTAMTAALIAISAGTMIGHAQAPGGPREGIKVHGYWTIDIREPDGTLVTHREFQNALVDQGLISMILGHVTTPGRWTILLESSGAVSKPCMDNNVAVPCLLQESDDAVVGGVRSNFRTLTVMGSSTSNAMILNGSATAYYASNIGAVTTLLGSCRSDVTPANCHQGANLGLAITQHILDPSPSSLEKPIPVSPGQFIQVTVTLTFS